MKTITVNPREFFDLRLIILFPFTTKVVAGLVEITAKEDDLVELGF